MFTVEVSQSEREALTPQAGFVLHISVDGLRPAEITSLGEEGLPNFYRLRREGAFTDNARTDIDDTLTLPNHASQLTGRRVRGEDGHGVEFNSDNGSVLAAVRGSYVAGVFDVVHDHGLRTGMYTSKGKFDFLERSWNGENGVEDTIGTNDGRDKIDRYVNESEISDLVEAFVEDMNAASHHYSFIHLRDPDSAGHDNGWGSEAYRSAIIKIDGLLGEIFNLIEVNPILTGRTALILTSDHGGIDLHHWDVNEVSNFTIPLYVWGPGISAGADLYRLNAAERREPGIEQPDYDVVPQPIRSGEVANLTLSLLGLPPVPGSAINLLQDLRLASTSVTESIVQSRLVGDFDDDGVVGMEDLFLFSDHYGEEATGASAVFDLNGNGAVDLSDFFAFAENFGGSASD